MPRNDDIGICDQCGSEAGQRRLTASGWVCASCGPVRAPVAVEGARAPVGQSWCPRHGTALCPEDYMLLSSGEIAPGYRGTGPRPCAVGYVKASARPWWPSPRPEASARP